VQNDSCEFKAMHIDIFAINLFSLFKMRSYMKYLTNKYKTAKESDQIRIFNMARITGVITKSTKMKSVCG